jgi:hypothetical protein
MVTSDPRFAGGSVIYKLLMHAFPGWYDFNSIYAIFPFSVPSKTRKLLEKFDVASVYSFEPPKKPKKELIYLSSYNLCIQVLGNQTSFPIMWDYVFENLAGRQYKLPNGPNIIQKKRYSNPQNRARNNSNAAWNLLGNIASRLIQEASFSLGEYFEIDIIRELFL